MRNKSRTEREREVGNLLDSAVYSISQLQLVLVEAPALATPHIAGVLVNLSRTLATLAEGAVAPPVVRALQAAGVPLVQMSKGDHEAFAGVEGHGWVHYGDKSTVVFDEKTGQLEVYGSSMEDNHTDEGSYIFDMVGTAPPAATPPLAWDQADQARALSEGWIMATRDDGTYAIERWDEGDVFPSDEAALDYVRTASKAHGTPSATLYQRALVMHGTRVP